MESYLIVKCKFYEKKYIGKRNCQLSLNQFDFSSFCKKIQIAFKVECLSKGLCLKPWAEVVSVTIAQLITLTVAK